MAAQGESPYAFYLREFYPKPIDLEDEVDALNGNVRDKNNCTPLHWAVYVCSSVCVSFLLAKPEVDINSQDIWGQTPLHKAVRRGDLRIIKQLIVKGADWTIIDQQGKTPFDLA